MRWLVLVAAAMLTSARARGAGFELAEQSPEAVGTAGAQTADAYAAAAVYYDPAALAFQPGLTVQAGADVIAYRGSAASSTGGETRAWSNAATPTVFVSQRLGARLAVGIGVFDPFARSIAYPSDWPGRAVGVALDLRAVAVNPSVALRPLPWLAIGFGVDIVATTLHYARAADSGAIFAVDASATGFGGNAAILVRVLRRWLDVAVSYRSALDVDLGGHASAALDARATLPLPHALAFALASRPLDGLTLTADVRLTLWRDLSALTINLTDPMLRQPPASETVALDWQDTVGVRVGAAWRWWRDADGAPRLTARLGAGWEQAPTSPAHGSPLFADGDRVLVGAGGGVRLGALSLDVGYLAAIAGSYVGASGSFVARYQAVTHTIAVALTLRLPDVPRRLDEPDFKR